MIRDNVCFVHMVRVFDASAFFVWSHAGTMASDVIFVQVTLLTYLPIGSVLTFLVGVLGFD